MKKINNLVLSALLLTGVVGCDNLSDFGDTNVNPSAVTTPVMSALLTSVQAGIGGYASNERGGLYSQYFSETQYTDASLYATPELAFTGYYSGHLNDLQNIINNTTSNNQKQIAIIMQQYIFWTATNLWGDVPYSEALQGAEVLQPKYDRQEDIYKGIFQKLGDAVSAFDNSPVAGDIIFGGNVDSWKRTANSLKVLAAIQLSKKVPAANGFAATAFKEALAASGGVITSNSQNFQVNYEGNNFQSPVYTRYLTRFDYGQSKTMTDMLGDFNDNRQSVYGSSDIGVPYGLARLDAEAFTSANPTWARILAPEARQPDAPIYIISAAQVALARAEAAEIGWTTENTASLYTSGIQLSHEQWGVQLSPGYLTQADVALGSENLKKISLQRYIASYPDGTQGWNIWRKSGYPVLTPAPAATNTSKEIPRRYVYAQAEFSSNAEGVNTAVANLPGGNTQDARVWWDQP